VRDADPVSNVPMNERYDGSAQDRYADEVDYHKGPAGTYNYRAVTIEEEAINRGWLPGARPTGPDPIDLMTIGMRGEPSFDDDPVAGNDGLLHHETPGAADNSSWD
jgi:hypothetical protein